MLKTALASFSVMAIDWRNWCCWNGYVSIISNYVVQIFCSGRQPISFEVNSSVSYLPLQSFMRDTLMAKDIIENSLHTKESTLLLKIWMTSSNCILYRSTNPVSMTVLWVCESGGHFERTSCTNVNLQYLSVISLTRLWMYSNVHLCRVRCHFR